MITIKWEVNSFALASLPSLSEPWLVTHVLSSSLARHHRGLDLHRRCGLLPSPRQRSPSLCGCLAAGPWLRVLSTDLTLQICCGLHEGTSLLGHTSSPLSSGCSISGVDLLLIELFLSLRQRQGLVIPEALQRQKQKEPKFGAGWA